MESKTGYLAYYTLEEYNLETGVATGVTKPNVPNDPDYVAPVYNLKSCPTGSTGGPEPEEPVVLTQVTLSRSLNTSSPCVGPNGTYFIDGTSIRNSTVMYRGDGVSLAPPGYYSDGSYHIYWDGEFQVGFAKQCFAADF